MKKDNLTRRQFLGAASAGAFATVAAGAVPALGNLSKEAQKPAILGGQPVRTKPFPSWPIIEEKDEKAILSALRSGVWSRGELVDAVEKRFAGLMGANYCLLTGSGTQALNTAVHVLGIAGGDEVLVTPYTFVATVDAILLEDALPVFIDIDPETFQINPDKLEEKITDNTKAILPVHINGGVANMDKINSIAAKYNLKVVEDACQSVLAEWRGKKAGTLGDLGCLSFQTSKNLTCGEGGAILGDDGKVMDLCHSFHNFGRPKGKYMSRDKGGHPILGTKYRISTFHAALLNSQMDRVEEQTKKRTENADYLTSRIKEIPGIIPRKDYKETTRTAYYKYALRYKKEYFNDIPRQKFLSALGAEGISCSWGLGVLEGLPINKEGLIEETLNSGNFKKIYSKERLDRYREQNQCPESDQLSQEVMGFPGEFFLGTRKDMDDIADAILKIYENRDKLV
ncbi:MAG TPA: DegT/DnrJ/EryC1/StrS family aminotransferase [archaeon]|nr:DegT/DnrJ/EryC1/StrS family aminotransferase [archaeon]